MLYTFQKQYASLCDVTSSCLDSSWFLLIHRSHWKSLSQVQCIVGHVVGKLHAKRKCCDIKTKRTSPSVCPTSTFLSVRYTFHGVLTCSEGCYNEKWWIKVLFFFLFLREYYCGGPLHTPASWRTWRGWPRASGRTWTPPKAWIPTKTRSITLWTEWPPRLCDRFNSEMSLTQCVCPRSPRRAIPHCFLPGADHPFALLGPPEPLFQPW